MVQRLFELEPRLPPWLRPAYRGALFICGMSVGWTGKLFVLLILSTLMLLAGAGRGVGLFFEILGVALVAGAVGGTLRGMLHPLERWGPFGSWLSWTLAICGYLAVVGLLTPAGPFSRQYPAFYGLAAGVCALAAGCRVLLDDRRVGRLSPDKFRALQGRERLWAAAHRASARRQGRPAP